MAHHLHASVHAAVSTRSFASSSHSRFYVPGHVQFLSALKLSSQPTVRRSADYQPPIWSFEYIQSLKTEYVGQSYTTRINKLKENVMEMLEGKEMNKNPLHQLQLIDALQRLGISYHFEDEIKVILQGAYSNNHGNYGLNKDCLCAAALVFRLLRQHGNKVPQAIFNSFIDESGNLKACLCKDCKGMLYLYEASFLSMEGEGILDAARTFTRTHLNEYVMLKESKDPYLSTLVEHSLEFPLHWRMPRMEARWFIEFYQQSPDMNPVLLDFAKLDFNMVQATYQEDLKHASMWWMQVGLGEKLEFIRDRLVENYLWTTGVLFQPQYGYFRRMATQVIALVTTIDDVYDVYGTLDELEHFTNAVERWDINAIEQLPDYMKLCFFALYNSTNQMASKIFQEQGLNILSYSKKAWVDLCKSYLIEAKWYHEGYTPTLHQYIDNAAVSISAPLLLLHAYLLSSNHITMEILHYIEEEFPSIIHCSSMVSRLANDLGTSPDEMKRGDVPKSIQCYMHEMGACEEDACKYIQDLIDITWKKMNKDRFEASPLPPTLIEATMNLARMAQFIYQYGDGHSSQDHVTKNRVLSLLINPIAWP
ncbi:hypothetical protein SLE2022_387480 [Rubroshorea leprosula]